VRALVTGSGRGLGLGLCEALVERDYEVVAACRRATAELAALDVRVVEDVDVTEPASADRIRDAVGDRPLDLIAANAGVNLSFDVRRIDDLDVELVEEELRVNAAGAVRSVLAAVPSLRAGAKILLITSGVAGPGRSDAGNVGYAMSKSALNTFGRSLAHELRPRGIAVAIVSPGATDTDILRRVHAAGRNPLGPNAAGRAPLESARNVLDLVDRASLESSGTFWAPSGHPILNPDGLPPVS
jgi:NAD(P)-dependent dehydrogenase (short-subunit alcohol dehydrogenase family)